jgi:putative endopeptidase
VGENIGDLGGLTIAHKAYLISLGVSTDPTDETEEAVSTGSTGETVDGLTGSQRLFLNWGYVWRGKQRQELALQRLTVDPHSPAEFRANIVRNLDEFHQAFGTADGDGLWLEPSERVRIW